MNNEDKILMLLEGLTSEIKDFKQQTTQRFDGIDTRLDKIEDDIEVIKEDVEITRDGTNTLLGWAERTQRIVNVPLTKD